MMNCKDKTFLSHLSGITALAFLAAALGFGTCRLVGQERQTPDSRSVASVQGKTITDEELKKFAEADLEKVEIQKLQFEAQYAQARQQIMETYLRRLIEDRVLDAEAAKRHITKQELITREITSKVQDPAQAEIDAYYEANKARLGPSKEFVAPQIIQYLRQQSTEKLTEAFIEPLKKEYAVVTLLEPLRMPLETKGSPSKGPDNAPVTLVVFSDYQCTFCQNLSGTLKRILSDYGDQVRLIYRQFPNPNIHNNAEKAAEASLCAQEQGRFWEMHDLLFQDPNKLKIEDLKAYAAQLGLNKDSFGQCLDSGKSVPRLKADFMDAMRAGAGGTPALYVNGRLLPGARPYDEIAGVINEELQKKHATGGVKK